jgi:phage N-6-adenine-methyltransferase
MTLDGVWGTPRNFFKRLDAEFKFNVDVCATRTLAKVRRYFSPRIDGLKQPWRGAVWCAPPYGAGIANWIEKAWSSARTGKATVVCLVFARTDTGWWRDYCMRADEIRFIAGRLTFEKPGAISHSPMPNALVIFRAGEGPQHGPQFSVYDWRSFAPNRVRSVPGTQSSSSGPS